MSGSHAQRNSKLLPALVRSLSLSLSIYISLSLWIFARSDSAIKVGFMPSFPVTAEMSVLESVKSDARLPQCSGLTSCYSWEPNAWQLSLTFRRSWKQRSEQWARHWLQHLLISGTLPMQSRKSLPLPLRLRHGERQLARVGDVTWATWCEKEAGALPGQQHMKLSERYSGTHQDDLSVNFWTFSSLAHFRAGRQAAESFLTYIHAPST